MQFCTSCGKTLSILNNTGAELCSGCKPKKKHPHPPPTTDDLFSSLLQEATLSVKNGKMILESKEGWLLWSGDKTQPHSLHTIAERATRILKIRKKQQK